MKQKIVLFLALTASGAVSAQQGDVSALRSAKHYLDKKSTQYDPEKAYDIYRRLSEKGNAEAANGIGMFYQTGMVMDQNEQEALHWFEKAGNLGYGKAWYNAGLIYKNGQSVQQNFDKAFACFQNAANLRSSQGLYATGYSYFKGLGCAQNYPKAVSYFQQAIPNGSVGAMYMLGICFRNGYGITSNKDSADYWLLKASLKGYKPASQEMETVTPEYTRTMQADRVNTNVIADKKVNLAQKINRRFSGNVTGDYKGIVVRYDWSGTKVISHNDVTLTLKKTDSVINGIWNETNGAVINITGKQADSGLVFYNSQYSSTDHYSTSSAVQFEFKKGDLKFLDKDGESLLTGNISFYAVDRMEPEKPVYVMLKRERLATQLTKNKLINTPSAEGEETFGNNKVSIYPNPFETTVQVSLSLKELSKVRIDMYSADGVLIYNNSYGTLGAGNHVLKLNPGNTLGLYFLRITINDSVFSKILLKK
jgi:hypothetical protein